MKLIKNSLYFALMACALTFTACDDDCDTTCAAGEQQLVDCSCVPVDTGCDTDCEDGQIQLADCSCIDDPDGNTVEVTGNVSENTTWTSDNVYVLGGRIAVTNGATLTIEPGTVVKGAAGIGANSTALLVSRGASIDACGTAALPIIFTSVADQITPEMVAAGNYSSPNLDPSQNGLWGGIIVLGNAPISAKNDAGDQLTELQIEGIPTSDSNGLYGGNDKEDNSGTLCYISIRHGGTNIGDGNEINGLTLGGVGSGTTINHVEVVANQDDGIEWFGGTVNVTNALVWACGDDGLDTDQAWNGNCDNWIVAVPAGGSAMELDGPEGDYSDGPHQFTNGVIYCGDNIDHIIDWDGNTNAGINRLYVFGIDSEYPAESDFEPIESFGGDMSGNTGQWEYTLPAGKTVEQIFTGVPTSALTETTPAGRSYGPSASDFAWTWGGHSGTLSSIGL